MADVKRIWHGREQVGDVAAKSGLRQYRADIGKSSVPCIDKQRAHGLGTQEF